MSEGAISDDGGGVSAGTSTVVASELVDKSLEDSVLEGSAEEKIESGEIMV
ncbi:MAG: hypothetical protein F6K16_30515 [Symploca sp. SIO2B6]|nr:hypothetical protein [Symploca sp. SIO2B6]